MRLTGAMFGSVLLCAAYFLIMPAPCSASVYSDLMAEFTKYDHRLPGSENFDRCLSALKQKLKDVGLEPHVQTFDTLVPHTEWCKFEVDGREIGPVYPMNNGVSPLITDGKISGPLVWLGDGSLEAMKGKDVQGSIALLDFDAPRLTIENVFPHGAQAVVFVGSDKASQWNVAGICQEGPVMVPQLYIDRKTAEQSGLLAAEGKMANIDAHVRLQDAVAKNLWVEIPGQEGTKFRLDSEEAVVLSATLDTFGVTPDFCPQVRTAANVALLADVACQLAGRRPKRSLFIVFLGSHYWGQEAARYFYYAVSKADKSSAEDTLAQRGEKYQEELDTVNRLVDTCRRTDVFEAKDDDAVLLTKKIKEKLVGWVNNINVSLREKRLEKMSLEKSLKKTAKQDKELLNSNLETGTDTQAKKIKSGILMLEQAIDSLMAQKSNWNALRKQITDKHFNEGDAENKATFDTVVEAVEQDIVLRKKELGRIIAHNRTFEVLAAGFENKTIVGHFDFDFANNHDPWLFSVIGDHSFFTGEIDVGIFLMYLDALGKVYKDIQDSTWKATLFGDALHPFYKPFSLCVPVQRSVPSTVGIMLGVAGYQMMTVGDPLDHDGLPLRETCDLSSLVPQMTAFADALANREELSLRRPFNETRQQNRLMYLLKTGDNYDGVQCVNYSRSSSDIEGPARNAVLLLNPRYDMGKLAGISRCPIARINGDGYVFIPMLSREITGDWRARVYTFGYDADGRLNRYWYSAGISSSRISLFYGYGGGAFSYGFIPDPLGSEIYKPRTLDVKSEGSFKTSCDVELSSIRAFYADEKGYIKRIGSNGQIVLGSTEDAPEGVGIMLDPRSLLAFDGIRQCANDYWLLNESRLKVLRKRNIVSDTLESLHAESREYLDDAQKAYENRDYANTRANSIFATCLENRVYAPLRGITDDLVKAVIVLLLLNIPFAFAMERLIFGFTSIYKQVLGFVGFFLATFAVLYVTHPAFSLAQAPIVIFLAFVIVLLGTITLNLVLGKIRQEIRIIQGLASTVHGVESDSSTALAAVLIGISGMRNRPLKTFLTAMTVILLTFTILVFASFTAKLGVMETYLGKGQDEDRIELHRFSYLDINEDLIRAIEDLHSQDYHVFRRGGIFRNPTKDFDQRTTPLSPDRVAYNPANGKTASLEAILGLDPGEVRVNAKMHRLIPGFLDETWTHEPLYLPAATAAKLQIQKGDKIMLIGRTFTYAGAFDQSVLQSMTTIENTKIVPPDFKSTAKNEGGKLGGKTFAKRMEEIDIGNFEWSSPEQVAITDIAVLQRYYPNCTYVNFLSLYPHSGDVDVEKTGKELAPIFHGAIHVKSGEGAKKLFFTKAVEGSGFNDVIVPFLLGGLIIFSSLMGSIVDREREIFTYSALGLSPPNVGALFFAESCVYSVVGGMGGYLLSQVVAKILAFLGSHGVFHPPDMNFSSLSSVLTILVVMVVVMLSTIYPALKAGKSANPGVARKWRMPAPKGDDLNFVFPFTVSEVDFAGILSFLKEHFENYGDVTLGSFAAKDVRLFKTGGTNGEKQSLGISANISLAPFDLGIFQKFRMYSKEFEIKGIDEVVVELKRIGGTPNAWVRTNRGFANELRQQFLLWRSLPIETVEHYRRQTQKELGVSQ